MLPREHNNTLVELAAIMSGANRQALRHVLYDALWDSHALNLDQLQQWQAHPWLGPHTGGVLIVDETDDPKRGQRIVLAAQQYLSKLGHIANGMVAVTSYWANSSRHAPLRASATVRRAACPEAGRVPPSTPIRSWSDN